MLGEEYYDDAPPWPADEFQCYCDAECVAYGDCCSGCGGSQGGGGGGGGNVELPIGTLNWWDLWNPPNVIYAGTTFAELPPEQTGPDLGFDFWNWFYGGFPNATNDLPLDPIPIDWTQIGTNINDCPDGQVAIYGRNSQTGETTIRCEAYGVRAALCKNGYNDPSDPSKCIPFPPGATEERKRQLTQQGNQAAASRNAAAQSQQQALQKAAQECAARGGKLIQTATGYGCQLPNGQVQSLSASGIPGWLIWALIALGVVVILK